MVHVIRNLFLRYSNYINMILNSKNCEACQEHKILHIKLVTSNWLHAKTANNHMLILVPLIFYSFKARRRPMIMVCNVNRNVKGSNTTFNIIR
jgi:hypothetical protein